MCVLGSFCIYSNEDSFEYIRSSLEKTLLSNLEQEDRLPFQGLPIVIMFVPEAGIDEIEAIKLREEGQNLADRYIQCNNYNRIEICAGDILINFLSIWHVQFAVSIYRCVHRRTGTRKAQKISHFVGEGCFAATYTIHKSQSWFFKYISECY